ncbi:response regulator [Desulfobulbus alkaliphilus]|uniref:response regulator n=1 Tax=Desulfobulbus alkaliphilus TaxID=869814 RepID=UPI0019655BB4|nr:response regulator [Desulfobulbus alkaliphilus]MBM9537291.1 response regulator [Desulfobulbus alkaliphilus]
MTKKILIVEDEPLIGLMLAENVRELGCVVTGVVTSGEAAIRAVQRDQPDGILMDISLNGVLDGVETARVIKAREDIPILFFTGYQDFSLHQRAHGVQPVGIVDKLDSTEAIKEAISSFLR